jgi:ATP-dependent helicase/nuclease subunit A
MEGLARNFFYEEDRLEERRKETAELRRLLYVAMTRARRNLYLSGAFPLGGRDGNILPALGEALEKKQKKRAKTNGEQGFRPLEGDSILDDGTFFGLLLPALLQTRPWLGEGGGIQEGPPPYLGIEQIPPTADQAVFYPANSESSPGNRDFYVVGDAKTRKRNRLPGPGGLEKRGERGYPNRPSGLARFFRDTIPRYTGGTVIGPPVLGGGPLSPSAAKEFQGPGGEGPRLRPAGTPAPKQAPASGVSAQAPGAAGGHDLPDAPFFHDAAMSGRGAEDVFAAAGPILSRTGAFAEFGSLAHLCVEARLTGKVEQVPRDLAGRLSSAEAETLLKAGKDLAGRFLASTLGIQAARAAGRWSEYPFRSLWEAPEEGGAPGTGGPGSAFTGGALAGGILVSGVIDLLYEWEDGLHLVDFKTDGEERPGEHLPQMAIYRRAAQELRGKDCRVWLYYLRSGRAVEIKRFGVWPLQNC